MVALLTHGVADLKGGLADRHQQLSAAGHKRPMKTEETRAALEDGEQRCEEGKIRGKRRCSGRSSQRRAVSQTGVSPRIKTASANSCVSSVSCGRPELRSGPGKKESWRRCQWACTQENITTSGMLTRLLRCGSEAWKMWVYYFQQFREWNRWRSRWTRRIWRIWKKIGPTIPASTSMYSYLLSNHWKIAFFSS